MPTGPPYLRRVSSHQSPLAMDVSRNAPCPCGSGRKYKACCAGKDQVRRGARTRTLLAVALLVGALLVLGALLRQDDGDAPPGGGQPGQVWSEEHGHWH